MEHYALEHIIRENGLVCVLRTQIISWVPLEN